MRKYLGLTFLSVLGLLSYLAWNNKPAPISMVSAQKSYPPFMTTSRSANKPTTTPVAVSKINTESAPQKTAEQLLISILSSNESQQIRRNNLYRLTEMGPESIKALSTLATYPVESSKSNNPHSAESIQRNFEIGLRITALEALDQMVVSHSQSTEDIKKTMMLVLEKQETSSLKILAQISLSGIANGRPGKLKRAIDHLLNEKVGQL